MAGDGGAMRGKVLVVEDDGALRNLYVQLLTEEGFQVIEATDGRAALREFETKRPDVVVLETYMSGSDGMDVLRRLNAAEHTAAIVLNTGAPPLKADRLASGADAFVAKSGDVTELVRTAHRFAKSAPLTVRQRATGRRLASVHIAAGDNRLA
jgi:two-component system response regulator (stage 0 sporulation protein F)